MPLIRDDDLIRIDLPAEGEWVEVKAKLSRGDQVAVQRAALAGSRLSVTGEIESLDAPNLIEQAEFAVLDRAVKRWSFPESVSPANIRRLDAESVECIKVRLNEIYPGPSTEAARANLSVNGQGPSEEKAAFPTT